MKSGGHANVLCPGLDDVPQSKVCKMSTLFRASFFAIFLYAVGLTTANINGQLNRRSDPNGRQFTFLHIHGAVSFVR